MFEIIKKQTFNDTSKIKKMTQNHKEETKKLNNLKEMDNFLEVCKLQTEGNRKTTEK